MSSPTVSMIVRHPIKSIGREELQSVNLQAGKWMPFDRQWAVSHERAILDGGWQKKRNFLRAVSCSSLMAITTTLDEVNREVRLEHPDLSPLTVKPDNSEDSQKLADWLRAIWSGDLPKPTGTYRAADAHMTDVEEPWISLNSMASLDALSHRASQELSPHRWRGNFWIEGLEPWEEFGWIGKKIRIGDAVLNVCETITRCKATMANPENGKRDVDTLGILEDLGHQEFGVYAEVIQGGKVDLGASVTVI